MRKKQTGAVVCLAALLVSGLNGCGGAAEKKGGLNIVTTVFPSYDFATQLAESDANVSLLLTPGGESHAFEPTASDISKIQTCDVFCYVGGESEVWVESVLESLNTDKIKVVRLFDCVDPLEEETVEGMEAGEHDHADEDTHDHAEEHHHDEDGEYDEHIWASPENAIKMTKAISEALISCDSAHESGYRARTDAYVEKLTALDTSYRAVADKAERKTVIFGDRFPFRYLTQAYGLTYYAAFPGCSSETEASPATLSFLIEKIKTEQVPLVLYTESSTQKIAERICEATGADSAMMHSCNNITKEEKADGATYLSLMEQNLKVLERALCESGATGS